MLIEKIICLKGKIISGIMAADTCDGRLYKEMVNYIQEIV